MERLTVYVLFKDGTWKTMGPGQSFTGSIEAVVQVYQPAPDTEPPLSLRETAKAESSLSPVITPKAKAKPELPKADTQTAKHESNEPEFVEFSATERQDYILNNVLATAGFEFKSYHRYVSRESEIWWTLSRNQIHDTAYLLRKYYEEVADRAAKVSITRLLSTFIKEGFNV